MHELTVYSRPGCHLCDEMLSALSVLMPGANPTVVNIDTDRGLLARFGRIVPVLSVDGDVVCYGRLDEQKLRDALAL